MVSGQGFLSELRQAPGGRVRAGSQGHCHSGRGVHLELVSEHPRSSPVMVLEEEKERPRATYCLAWSHPSGASEPRSIESSSLAAPGMDALAFWVTFSSIPEVTWTQR